MSTPIRTQSAKSRRAASARINLRIDPQLKALLMRAANLRQLKLTEFMVKASEAAAENALAERTRFVLSPEKWREFNTTLDAPARPIPALRKLLTEPTVFDPP